MSRAASVLNALLLAWACMSAAACNRPACDGSKYEPQEDDPVITDMRLVGQQEGDPWTLILSMAFDAPKGNAGDGNAFFFVGSQTPSKPMPLYTYFNASNVQLDAQSGVIAVPLTFVQVGIDYDATVRLGARIVDADARPSNCYSMDLNFQLSEPVAFLRRALGSGSQRAPT